jgi:heat-inducible transcriptional repressor
MAELEEAGYIYQPHTSAGRVPTENGYLFYVENYVLADQSGPPLNSAIKRQLDRLLRERSTENLKSLAKILADLSDSLIILAFDEDRFYFTGLTYLYSQPEFADQAAVTTVSQVLDHCEQVMAEIFDLVSQDKRVLIGRANPFSSQCSFLAAPVGRGLIGILGPLRMDYEMNFNLMEYVMKHEPR